MDPPHFILDSEWDSNTSPRARGLKPPRSYTHEQGTPPPWGMVAFPSPALPGTPLPAQCGLAPSSCTSHVCDESAYVIGNGPNSPYISHLCTNWYIMGLVCATLHVHSSSLLSAGRGAGSREPAHRQGQAELYLYTYGPHVVGCYRQGCIRLALSQGIRPADV